MIENENEPADAELLSALMDDELPPEQRAALLRRLESEPGLQARWGRYHAARAALTTGAARLGPDFAARVRLAREREPAVLAPSALPAARPAWMRPAAGVAIAAAVALVAIGGLSVLRDSLPTPSSPGVAGSPVATRTIDHDGVRAIRPVAVSAGAEGAAIPSKRVRKRLMLYLASHSEYADTVDVPTGITYGRLGSINAGQ